MNFEIKIEHFNIENTTTLKGMKLDLHSLLTIILLNFLQIVVVSITHQLVYKAFYFY